MRFNWRIIEIIDQGIYLIFNPHEKKGEFSSKLMEPQISNTENYWEQKSNNNIVYGLDNSFDFAWDYWLMKTTCVQPHLAQRHAITCWPQTLDDPRHHTTHHIEWIIPHPEKCLPQKYYTICSAAYSSKTYHADTRITREWKNVAASLNWSWKTMIWY